MQACLASLFELPLEEIPEFGSQQGTAYFEPLQEWLARFGLALLVYPWWNVDDDNGYLSHFGYHLLTGKGRGQTLRHIVVCERGKVVHDPLPNSTGLAERDDYWFFVSLNPALNKGFDVCNR